MSNQFNTCDNAAFETDRALVVGASGRMVAMLLSRLNIECSVADLYGDVDTGMICNGRVHKLKRLTELLDCETLIRSHQFVVFAGGLEGHSEVAKQLTQWTTPAFPTSGTVAQMVDVDVFNKSLSDLSVDRYPLHTDVDKASWPAVAKDVTHSATAKLVHSNSGCHQRPSKNRVLQDFIDGESVSQIYVAADGHVECLGGSLQLTDALKWTGSISGLELMPRDQEVATGFASAIATKAKFNGVFGVDFIRTHDGIWPVDVNPRIPASSEVIGGSVIRRHLNAFGLQVEANSPEPVAPVLGKAVVFNQSDSPIIFGRGQLGSFPFRHSALEHEVSIADLPHDGERIESGHPVLTVFATGNRQGDVKAKLKALQHEIYHCLVSQNC